MYLVIPRNIGRHSESVFYVTQVHIVDNVLLVHNIESKVTMMFDIKSKKDLGGFPVASPLPLSPVPYPPLFTFGKC